MGELLHCVTAIGSSGVSADAVVAGSYPDVAIGIINDIGCYESGLKYYPVIGIEAVNGIVRTCPYGSVAVYVHVIHIVAHSFTCKRYWGDLIAVKSADSISCSYPYQSVTVLYDSSYGV